MGLHVINVASIDLHAKKITDAGGKIIIPKTTVLSMVKSIYRY